MVFKLQIKAAVRKHLFEKAAAIYQHGIKMEPKWTKMEPRWCQNGAQMVPKGSPNRPRDVPREVPKTRSQKKPLAREKNGHVGAHGRILSELGAALGAILEKGNFEGGP